MHMMKSDAYTSDLLEVVIVMVSQRNFVIRASYGVNFIQGFLGLVGFLASIVSWLSNIFVEGAQGWIMSYPKTLTALTVMAFFMIVTPVLAAKGVHKKSLWLLIASLCTLALMLTAKGIAIMYHSSPEPLPKSYILKKMAVFNRSLEEQNYWNNIHRTYDCCGLDSPSDWGDFRPKSCCREFEYEEDDEIDPVCARYNDSDYIRKHTCFGVFKEHAEKSYNAANAFVVLIIIDGLEGIFIVWYIILLVKERQKH